MQQASPNQEVDPEAAAEATNEERATDDAAATATNGSCEKAEEHEGAGVANAGKTEAVSSTSAPDEPTASAPAKPAPKMRRLELKKTAAPATTEKGKASKPVNSPGKVAKENVRTEDKTSEDDTNDQPSNQQDAAKEAPTVAAKKVKLPTFKSKAASGPPDPATFKVKKASEVAVKKKTSGASSGGKEKKDKKDKKPRAKTSYMFFCADNRTTLAGACARLQSSHAQSRCLGRAEIDRETFSAENSSSMCRARGPRVYRGEQTPRRNLEDAA